MGKSHEYMSIKLNKLIVNADKIMISHKRKNGFRVFVDSPFQMF